MGRRRSRRCWQPFVRNQPQSGATLDGYGAVSTAAPAASSAFRHVRRVDVVEELGFDAAIDYKRDDFRKRLRELAPDGVDVFFDNVGGEQLEAAIGAMRLHGRIALCGAISVYNATEPPPGPRNLTELIGRRVRMQGMLVTDHGHLRDRFVADVAGWVASGAVRYRETIVDGLEHAPQAFIDLLRGANTGKMLVRIPA